MFVHIRPEINIAKYKRLGRMYIFKVLWSKFDHNYVVH